MFSVSENLLVSAEPNNYLFSYLNYFFKENAKEREERENDERNAFSPAVLLLVPLTT